MISKFTFPILILCLATACSESSEKKSSTKKDNTPEVSTKDTTSVKTDSSENPHKSTGPVYGIDISQYQADDIKSIDPQKDSLSFIISQATQGVTFLDSNFKTNWAVSKSIKVTRGAYHFYMCQDDPLDQVSFFLNTVSGFNSDDLPPIVDFEETSIDKSQSSDTIQVRLLRFLNEIENRTERTPMIYTDYNTGSKYLKNKEFAKYPLWISDPNKVATPKLPETWEDKGWAFWQMSYNHEINGVPYDYDKFNGDLKDLQEFISKSHI